MSALALCPVSFAEACAFVMAHHRHHRPPVGFKFCMGVTDGEAVRGVAIVGRPVSRHYDNGWTLEVTRCATDGAKDACSMLYGACRRATFALGYKRLVTYTLPEEGGASLRAAGYRCIGEAGGDSWDRKARPRVDAHPLQTKLCWEAAP